MLTREVLDRTMRDKAQDAGAELREASYVSQDVQSDGKIRVKIRYRDEREEYVNYDAVIGADGAASAVAKSVGRPAVKHASAIQERIEFPPTRWSTTRIAPSCISATISRPTSTAGCSPRAITSRSGPAADPNTRIVRTRSSKA